MHQPIIDWIDQFELKCNDDLCTDIGEAWDLLHLIRSTLADAEGKQFIIHADKDTGEVQDIFLADENLEAIRKAFERGLDAVAVTAILTDLRPFGEGTTEEDRPSYADPGPGDNVQDHLLDD